MKTKIPILLCYYFILGISSYAQDPQTHFILDNHLDASQTKDYLARDYVQMINGFSTSPYQSTDLYVHAKTDPLLVFPPENGDITGGSTNNNEGGVVGTLPGNLTVSPSGAAVYSIPIELPTGVNRMTPSLSLVYNSQGGNGLLGVGWSLSGLSMITRIGSDLFHDENTKNVRFNNSDHFSLDGQRLIPINFEKTEFRTEKEVFSKILIKESNSYGPIWFEVWTKDGFIYEYGRSKGSKEYYSDNTDIYSKWKVNRISDRNGNYIDFVYSKDNYSFGQDSKQLYIYNILYGGNIITNQEHIYKIEFDLEKGNYTKEFLYGDKDEYKYFIKNILITHIETETIIEKYQIDYETTVNLRRQIKTITLFDNEGNKLNPTTFIWGSAQHEPEIETLNYNYTNTNRLFLDYNGDGKTDMIELNCHIDNDNRLMYTDWTYRERLDNGFSAQQAINANINHYPYQLVCGDFNGDGLEDVVRFIYWSSAMCVIEMDLILISNGSGFTAHTLSGMYLYISEDPAIIHGDFDGDGATELILSEISYDENGTSNNTSIIDFLPSAPYYQITHEARISFGTKNWSSAQLHSGDFDGDGKTDILTITEWEDTPNYRWSIYTFDVQNNCLEDFCSGEDYPATHHRVFKGDFNNDRITDVLTYNSTDGWELKYFNGKDEWDKTSVPSLYLVDPFGVNNGYDNTYYYSFVVADFNGDGKSDIAQFHKRLNENIADYDIYYYNGFYERFSGEIPMVGGFVTHGEHNILYNKLGFYNDFNGDGKADLYSFNGIAGDDEIYFFDINYKYSLIEKVINGLGHETDITYGLLTDNNIYIKGANASYPLLDIQPPITVVSEILTDNGVGTKSTTSLSYGGAKMHLEGKGFLGFDNITTINNKDTDKSTKIIQEFEIDNDFYFRWLKNLKNYASVNGNYEIINETTNEEPIIKEFDDKRIFYYTPNSITNIFSTGDDNSSYVKTILTKQYFSATDILHGNLTSITVYTDPENFNFLESTDSYDFYKEIDYKYTDDEVNWLFRIEEIETKKWDNDDGNIDNHRVINSYCQDSPLIQSVTSSPNNSNEYTTIQSFQYDNYGNITQQILSASNFDPAPTNRIIDYVYGDEYQNRVVTKESASTQNVEYTKSYTYYNTTGLLKTSTDVNELTTSFYYDGFGRLQKTIYPNGVYNLNRFIWSQNHSGNPINGVYYCWSQTSGMKETISFYDNLERELLVVYKGIDDQNIYKEQKYDQYGNLCQISNSHYNSTDLLWINYEYLSTGLVKRIISPTNVIENSYNGRATSINNTTLGLQSSSETNAIGKIISKTDNSGSIYYTYYSSEAMKTISFGNNNIQYYYDNAGFSKKTVDPNAGTVLYTYNPFGEIVSQTNAKGNTYKLKYDALGRIESKYLEGSLEDITTYIYCSKGDLGFGKIRSISKSNGISTNYSYDNYSRINNKTEIIDNNEYNYYYQYDIFGNLKEMTWPSGYSIKHHYNNGYLCSIEQSDNGKTLWQLSEMNAQGQIKQYLLGNDLTTINQYDIYGNTTSITTNNDIQKDEYDFNITTGNLNWRSSIIYPPFGNNTLQENFTYDNVLKNRLKSWSIQSSGIVYSVEYDNNGNIINKSDVGVYKYENINEGPNAVSKIEDTIAEYLSHSKQNEQLITYTPFDKIQTISQFDPSNTKEVTALEIVYGPIQSRKKSLLYKSGELIRKKIFVDDTYEVIEDDESNIKQIHYLFGGNGLFAVYVVDDQKGKAIYYTHKDYLGSIEIVTDEEGNATERFSYDPWGNRRNPTDWSFNDVPEPQLFDNGYTGHEHLSSFGLINMNGRSYDPMLARFLSTDNYIENFNSQGLNRYSYVYNNPMVYTDPSGEDPFSIIGVSIYLCYLYLKTAHDNRDENGNWAWNIFEWGKDEDFHIQVTLKSNFDFNSLEASIYGGPGSYNPGVSFDTDKGFGMGYSDQNGYKGFYPSYNYYAPEQNASAAIDQTMLNWSKEWREKSQKKSMPPELIGAFTWKGFKSLTERFYHLINEETKRQGVFNNSIRRPGYELDPITDIKVPKGIKFIGKWGGTVFSAYSVIETHNRWKAHQINTGTMFIEQGSNTIGAFPVIGTYWSLGWYLGYDLEIGPTTWYGDNDYKYFE